MPQAPIPVPVFLPWSECSLLSSLLMLVFSSLLDIPGWCVLLPECPCPQRCFTKGTQDMLVVDSDNNKFKINGSSSKAILCSKLYPGYSLSLKDLNILEGTPETSKLHSFSAWEAQGSGRQQSEKSPGCHFGSDKTWDEINLRWSPGAKLVNDQATGKFRLKTEIMKNSFSLLNIILESSQIIYHIL